MKRIIFSTAILLCICSIAEAQTTGSNSSNSTGVSSSTKNGKSSKSNTGKKTAGDTLNNRKIYNWKDGQRATPTGHEATGTNGGYAALNNDSATTRRDSTKQQ